MKSLFDQENDRPGPVFIGGVGGSGTRAVAGILRQFGVSIGLPLNVELDALAFDAVCERYVTPVLEQTGSVNHDIREVDDALRDNTLTALELAAAAHLAEERSVVTWAAKSPRLLYLMPYLRAAFPGCRFVHVVRDGRDMAVSGNQNQVREHFRAMFDKPIPRDTEHAAMRLWSTVNVDAATHGHLTMGSRYQILRYEDLSRAPAETIGKMMAGLGLSVDAAATERAVDLVRPSTTMGRGVETSDVRRSKLEAIGGRGLRFFGYQRRDSAGCAGPKVSKPVVFVAGCDQAATSTAAGAVADMGFDIGRSEMPPDRSNPGGYWKNSALISLNDRLLRAFDRRWRSLEALPADWLASSLTIERFRKWTHEALGREMDAERGWCINDRALCKLLPFWLDIARGLGRTPKVVLVVRHPLEVAVSMERRDGFSRRRALRIWAINLLESEWGSRDVSRLILRHDELVGDPDRSRATIAGFLEIDECVSARDALKSVTAPECQELAADYTVPAALEAWTAASQLAVDDSSEVRDRLRRALEALRDATTDAYFDQALHERAKREAALAADRTRVVRDLDKIKAISSAGSAFAALEAHLVRPLPSLDDLEGYERWIDTFEPTLALPRVELEKRFPEPTVVALLPGNDMTVDHALSDHIDRLRAAGASIVASSDYMHAHQWLGETCRPSPALDAIPRPDWLPRLVREGAVKWFIFIEPGPHLAEDFTARIVAAMLNHADARILHGDHDRLDNNGSRSNPIFKPIHWDQDSHLQANIIRGWVAVTADTLDTCASPNGSSAWEIFYDLTMRVTEPAPDDRIRHIPHVLAHVPVETPVTIAMLEAGAERVRREALARRGYRADLGKGAQPLVSRVHWVPPEPEPLVSVIVLTRDGGAHLQTCLVGLLKETRYSRIEVIIIDNGSRDAGTLSFLASIGNDPRCRVFRHDIPFNFAELVNLAVKVAHGTLLCLLNDDIRFLQSTWLDEMVGLAARADVGMVGAHLLFDDGTIQHAGVVLGLEGHVAGHLYHYASENEMRVQPLHNLVRQISAVTAACCVMRREVFEAVGGMDAENLAVNYNDVDLCLRIRDRGLKILWTPYARLVHAESLSRGKAAKAERIARSTAEGGAISARWSQWVRADPFWNPSLSLENVVPKLSFLPRAHAPVENGAEWTRARLLDASRDVARTAKILPDLPAFHAAKLATHLGLSDSAATFAIEAVVSEPDKFTANLAAGTCLARVEDLEKAATLYRNANLISPIALRPWLYLGQVEARRGRHRQALEYVDEVLRRDPSNEQAKTIKDRLTGSS
jgi:O-antigen biosynthesis protein